MTKATIKTSEIDRLRQECERLTNKLNDWSETYNAIIEDKTCVSDEYHCGCVPALREEIGRLRIALEVIGNVPSDV